MQDPSYMSTHVNTRNKASLTGSKMYMNNLSTSELDTDIDNGCTMNLTETVMVPMWDLTAAV